MPENNEEKIVQTFDNPEGEVKLFGESQNQNADNSNVNNNNQDNKDENVFETPDQIKAKEDAAKIAQNQKKQKVDETGKPMVDDKGQPIYQEPVRKQKVGEDGKPLFDENKQPIYEEEKKDEIFSLDENQKRELGFVPVDEIASKFDITLGENERTPEILVQKLTEKLEAAAQKVELDKTKYDEQTQAMFNYIEQGGKAIDLIDITKPFNDYFLLSPEEKMRYILTNDPENKMSIVEANAKIDSLKEEGTFDTEVQKLVAEVKGLRDAKVNETIKKQQSFIDAQKSEAKATKEKEDNTMVETLMKTKDFMGIALPEETKKYVAQQIKIGAFHKEMNTAESQVMAYLFKKFGSKILIKLQEESKLQSNKAHNEGFDKVKKTLHQSPEIGGVGSGHSAAKENTASPFATWGENSDLKKKD